MIQEIVTAQLSWSIWGSRISVNNLKRVTVRYLSYVSQGFPQDKIIAGCSVFIAGHKAIFSLIYIYIYNIFNHLLDIKAGQSAIKAGQYSRL